MRLKAENICFRYGPGKHVLDNVTFQVESGEVAGLTAPSGFGKTTLARILAGYQKPESGRVTLEGPDVARGRYNPVQLIFQHPEKAVNPKWKMKKILAEPGNPFEELLDPMGIRKEWMNRWPSELSGGELQRFCVLRALSPKTKFIIADEMTTMLDAITQAQIWETVLAYAELHHIGVVVISHDMSLIRRICGRVVNLSDSLSSQPSS